MIAATIYVSSNCEHIRVTMQEFCVVGGYTENLENDRTVNGRLHGTILYLQDVPGFHSAGFNIIFCEYMYSKQYSTGAVEAI